MNNKASIINIGLIWTAMTATVSAVLWMFSTFASASEVEAIRLQLLRTEIRELKKEIRSEDDEEVKEYLEEDLEVALDELCELRSDARECDEPR